MLKSTAIPVALTIAGSDSGGGAGIQADLKTFAALGVHGTCAITCLTAQNPKQVLAIEPSRPKMVGMQINAVFAELPPAAIKIGMLYSSNIIKAVVRALGSWPRRPLVVDPVMISTSGRRLLDGAALNFLKARLLPLATLVTPNLDEAEVLASIRIGSIEDMQEAARKIYSRFGCAALVKGGHFKQPAQAIDVFFDGNRSMTFKALRVRGVRTHGTGCTYSAAITAYLAQGKELTQAVNEAKKFITRSIAKSRRIGRHFVFGLL